MSALTMDNAYVVWSYEGDGWLGPSLGSRFTQDVRLAVVFSAVMCDVLADATDFQRYKRYELRELLADYPPLTDAGTVLELLRTLNPTTEKTL